MNTFLDFLHAEEFQLAFYGEAGDHCAALNRMQIDGTPYRRDSLASLHYGLYRVGDRHLTMATAIHEGLV